jgi:predicted ester cyclase
MKFHHFSLLLLLSATSFSNAFTQEAGGKQSANEKVIHIIFEEGINKKNLSIFRTHYLSDVIDHSAFPGQKPHLEGFITSVKELHETFPDIKVKLEDVISEGDLIATRESWSATDKTSGKKLTGWVLHMFKFKSGKVSEEWSKGWEWLSGSQ